MQKLGQQHSRCASASVCVCVDLAAWITSKQSSLLTNSGSISLIIYRSLGHIARLGPHAAAATEPFGAAASAVESTQIDQPVGE